jgi:hypothetical protein
MKIVILGWGSLVWDQGDIPLKTEWKIGGPELPIEFSRVSDRRKGALTLVIDPDNGENVPTRFAISKRTEIEDAICDVRTREETVVERIGYINLVDGSQRCNIYPEASHAIRAWASKNSVDGVVWTDLPSNFVEKFNVQFSVKEAVRYLHDLPVGGTAEACKYIVKAPQEVDTPLRRALKDDPWLKGNLGTDELSKS